MKTDFAISTFCLNAGFAFESTFVLSQEKRKSQENLHLFSGLLHCDFFMPFVSVINATDTFHSANL